MRFSPSSRPCEANDAHCPWCGRREAADLNRPGRSIAPFQEGAHHLGRDLAGVAKVVRREPGNPKYFTRLECLPSVRALERHLAFEHDAGFRSDDRMKARAASRFDDRQLDANRWIV